MPDSVTRFFGTAPMAQAVTTATIAALLFSHAIRSVLDWPGYIGVLGGLVVVSAAVLIARHPEFEWYGILPVSLLLFVAWCAISIAWSGYQWATLAAVLFQVAIGFLGVAVALSRDLIQIVRAFGDVFRVFFAVSLILEVLSGILLDLPFRFLGIEGRLADGGPIQGVAGSRNLLGILALFAAITFAVEYATRSVRRPVAAWSLGVVLVVLLLTRSPVSLGIAVLAGLVALALVGIRRTPPERRRPVQLLALLVALVTLVTAYLLRTRILELAGAAGEVDVRVALWRSVGTLARLHPLEGFGWVGSWRSDLAPFYAIVTLNGRTPTTALNAFVDVWFQVGIIGLALFSLLLGLALVRAWIVASNRRNVAHLWPALVLVVLALTAVAESATLVEYGWFLLVIGAVKAAQELSWRRGLR